ncbi:MAG: hypothetical protein AAGC88_14305 [Bacteroidota bacterium]
MNLKEWKALLSENFINTVAIAIVLGAGMFFYFNWSFENRLEEKNAKISAMEERIKGLEQQIQDYKDVYVFPKRNKLTLNDLISN